MANCAEKFIKGTPFSDEDVVLVDVNNKGIARYKDMIRKSASAQKLLESYGLSKGDRILIFERPSIELYSLILGAIGLGIQVVFVEPWMPLNHINEMVKKIRPRIFFSSLLGQLWSLKIKSLRKIPHWCSSKKLLKFTNKEDLKLIDVEDDFIATIVFTSGTNKLPKGVPRDHGHINSQLEIMKKSMGDFDKGIELTIFPNMVLANLAMGRPTLLMSDWDPKTLQKLSELKKFCPRRLICGPGFLIKALKHCKLPNLQEIYVGGALSDCWIFEETINKWPRAKIFHVYGSSEVEPVNIVDAKEAVRVSQEKGFFQCVYFGKKKIDEISLKFGLDSLWVSGPHVCEKYLYNDEENQKNKINKDNVIWHNMGDRIIEDDGLWFGGRSFQKHSDFILEQKIYSILQNSKSFIHRDENDVLHLYGENVKNKELNLLRRFPEISEVRDIKIVRDRRHKARIDRKRSIKKGLI